MSTLSNAIVQAGHLIISADSDLIDITLRSLQVSIGATLIASIIGLPFGCWLALTRFRFRRAFISILNAFMGLPPVVVGLLVYLLLSRSGPLGVFGLLYTPLAMIFAQVIIIAPIITSLAHQSMRELWADYHDLLLSMSATKVQCIQTLLWDGRRSLLTAGLAGLGRAIGEVGAIMIVGGNIDELTRVLTTAIALETSKGNFALALALGLILIALSIVISFLLHSLSRTEREARW